MTLKKKRGLIIAFALVITGAATAFGLHSARAESQDLALDLVTTNTMFVDTNFAVPTSTGITDARTGLLLTGGNGASAEFTGNFSGKFDIEFMPYSTGTYSGSDCESGVYSNSAQDLSEMSLVFTDAADRDNTFKIRLTGGAAGSHVTANASVEYRGRRAGIHYYRDTEAYGNTSGANMQDVYTFLWGTSFSNVAVSGGVYAASNVSAVKLSFDPVLMQVTGYSHGYNRNEGKEILIWNMSLPENDGYNAGFSVDGFEKYNVSLVFDEVQHEKANVVIYSLCGQSLAGTALVNNAGARAYASAVSGTSGENYIIPEPSAYDVIDGEIPFNGSVSVSRAGRDYEIYPQNGKYTKGCYFIPDAAGTYLLTLFAEDCEGIAGIPCEVTVSIADMPQSAPVFDYGEIADDYPLGSSLNVPDCEASYNGQSVLAAFAVVFPSGEIIKEKHFTLSERGMYKIIYTAEFDSVTYTKEVSFYSLTSAVELFKGDTASSVVWGVSPLSTKLRGIVVNAAAENASVSFTETIDFTDKTAADRLIEIIALPAVRGNSDFYQITVTLTDTEDSNNTVTVVCYRSPAAETAGFDEFDYSFVRAGATGQMLSGLNRGEVQTAVGTGTRIYHSFSGESKYKDIAEQTFCISMDYAERKIYTSDGQTVIDLDAPEYFSVAWEGFKENKAVINVSVQSLQGGAASYMILSADGKRFDELYYRDTVAPVISIDDTNLPIGVVNKKFPLLAATAEDYEDGSVKVFTEVYFGKEKINIEDNAFLPRTNGTYKIIYTAVDKSGNLSVSSVDIEVVASLPEMVLETDGNIQDRIGAGTLLKLPVSSVSGGSGRLILTVEIKSDSGEIFYAENGVFRFTDAGNYTVTYRLRDYIGNEKTLTFIVQVFISDGPVFGDAEEMPRVLVSGVSTRIPEVFAYDYNTAEPTRIIAEASWIYNGIENTVKGGVFTPVINTLSDIITLRYTAIGSKGRSQIEYNIPVQRVRSVSGEINMAQYFLQQGIESATAADEYIDFTADVSGASLSFVKSLPANGFEISFKVPYEANNTDKLTVRLTDAENSALAVDLWVEKGSPLVNTSILKINGDDAVEMYGSYYGNSNFDFRLYYNNNNYTVADGSAKTVATIKNYVSGERFKGFPSGKVNCDIIFGEVSGTAVFRLVSIANQGFNNITADLVRPIIAVSEEIVRSADIEDLVKVPYAVAGDVLGFFTTVALKVVAPDKSAILTAGTADKDYSFKAEQYGVYMITYTAEDENGRTTLATYSVEVADKEAPTVTVGAVKSVYKAGARLKMPKVTASDNVTANPTVMFYVITPDGYMHHVEGGSRKFTVRGAHILRVYVTDEAGNGVIKDFEITVK